MGPEFGELVTLLDRGGVLVLLGLIIFGGMRRWFVWQWYYQELEKDRDWWRSVAITSLQLGEKAVKGTAGTRGSMERRVEILEDQLGWSDPE